MQNIQPLSKTIAAPEHIEQVRLVSWFRDNFKEPDYIIFAVPNGGKRGGEEAERLRKKVCLGRKRPYYFNS